MSFKHLVSVLQTSFSIPSWSLMLYTRVLSLFILFLNDFDVCWGYLKALHRIWFFAIVFLRKVKHFSSACTCKKRLIKHKAKLLKAFLHTIRHIPCLVIQKQLQKEISIYVIENHGYLLKKYYCKFLTLLIQLCLSRSILRRCSIKKVVLRNFAKFTGKHLCQSLLQA